MSDQGYIEPPNGFRWDGIPYDPNALAKCLRHDPPKGKLLFDEEGAFDPPPRRPAFSAIYYRKHDVNYVPVFYDPHILKQTHAIDFSAVLFMHGLADIAGEQRLVIFSLRGDRIYQDRRTLEITSAISEPISKAKDLKRLSFRIWHAPPDEGARGENHQIIRLEGGERLIARDGGWGDARLNGGRHRLVDFTVHNQRGEARVTFTVEVGLGDDDRPFARLLTPPDKLDHPKRVVPANPYGVFSDDDDDG